MSSRVHLVRLFLVGCYVNELILYFFTVLFTACVRSCRLILKYLTTGRPKKVDSIQLMSADSVLDQHWTRAEKAR